MSIRTSSMSPGGPVAIPAEVIAFIRPRRSRIHDELAIDRDTHVTFNTLIG